MSKIIRVLVKKTFEEDVEEAQHVLKLIEKSSVAGLQYECIASMIQYIRDTKGSIAYACVYALNEWDI